MSDHADIVKRALSWCEEGEMGNRHRNAALAALDALVAERDEAQRQLYEDNHATKVRERILAAESQRDAALGREQQLLDELQATMAVKEAENARLKSLESAMQAAQDSERSHAVPWVWCDCEVCLPIRSALGEDA